MPQNRNDQCVRMTEKSSVFIWKKIHMKQSVCESRNGEKMKERKMKQWLRSVLGVVLCMTLVFGMSGISYAQDVQSVESTAKTEQEESVNDAGNAETAGDTAEAGKEEGTESTENMESAESTESTENAENAKKQTQEVNAAQNVETEEDGDTEDASVTVSLEIQGYGECLQERISVTMPQEYKSLQDYGFSEEVTDPRHYTVLHALAEYAVQNNLAEMGKVAGAEEINFPKDYLIDWFGYNEALGLNNSGSSGVGFMYLVNGVIPDYGMTACKLTSGMEIVLYDAWWCATEFAAYSKFVSVSTDAEAGKSFQVQLNVIGGSAKGIQIEVLDKDGKVVPGSSATKTDSNGIASVRVPSEGEYTLTAMKYSGYYDAKNNPGQLITRPYASVSVAKGKELSDKEAVDFVKEQLSIPEETDENVELQTEADYGVSITWETKNEELIQADGTVTRPAIKDAETVLTATITRGEVTETKEFTVTVKGIPLLKSLSVTPGALEFAENQDSYTVYVKEETEEITVTTQACEDAFMLRFGVNGNYAESYFGDDAAKEQTYTANLNSDGITTIDISVNATGSINGTITIQVKKATNPGAPLPELPNEWGQHLGGANNNAVVNAPTPTEGTELKWESRTEEQGAWGTAYAGHPILVNGNLYVARNNQIQILDRDTGKLLKSADLATSLSYYSYPTYGEGKIFVPLGSGQVQCFNAETLESLFITYVPKTFMQGLSSVHYKEGMIYVGYTNGAWSDENLTGGFAAYSTVDLDKEVPDELIEPDWVYEGSGSYYGMGAVTVTVDGNNYLVFAGDDGKVVCADPKTGEVKDTKSVNGKVRCALVYAEGALWFTSQDGAVHKFAVGVDGTLAELASGKLPSTTNASPVVVNDKVIVTGGVWGTGYLYVFDMDLNLLVKEELSGSANTPTVSTGYEDTYVYFVINAKPDTLYGAKITVDNQLTVEALYTSPADHANYTMSNVVVAEDGTIYYGNDAGYLIALKPGTTKPEEPDTEEPEEPAKPSQPEDKKEEISFTKDTSALNLASTRTLKQRSAKKQNFSEVIAEKIEEGNTSLTITDVPDTLEAEVFEELAKHPEFQLILDYGTYTISMKGKDVTDTKASLSVKMVEKEKTEHSQMIELKSEGKLPGKLTVVYKLPEHLKNAEELWRYEDEKMEKGEQIAVKDGYAMFVLEKAGEFILSDAEPKEAETEVQTTSYQEEGGEQKAETPSWTLAAAVILGAVIVLGVVIAGRKKRNRTWEE